MSICLLGATLWLPARRNDIDSRAGFHVAPKPQRLVELCRSARRCVVVLLATVLILLSSGDVVSVAEYQASRRDLEGRRERVAAQWAGSEADRGAARTQARRAILAHLDGAAFPAWAGTPWGFYGTTTTPHEGTIACGYFVTTVLEQAGFKLERVALAQQASAWLVKSVARGSEIAWLREQTPQQALSTLKEKYGDGLLVVGLDYHAGLLRLEGERAAFCHAGVFEPAAVVCEDPLTSLGFRSHLYVVADVLNDSFLDDWILAREVPSLLPPKPRTR